MDFLQKIPCIVIHRGQDKEREPFIIELEKILELQLQVLEAVDGSTLSLPRKHPWEKEPTSLGNLGCTASHIQIIDYCIKNNLPYVCIFEDDAEVLDVKGVNRYLNEVLRKPWDICFLGVNELVDADMLSSAIARVKRFWGTHAVILNQKAMITIQKTYERSLLDGYGLPADWLYTYAIKKDLLAFAPVIPLVRQRPGIVSVISGKVRN